MSNGSTRRPYFDLGRIVATPGALDALRKAGQQPHEFLTRHVSGDWGELGDEDLRLNDTVVTDGSRILSAYTTRKGVKVWVITEAMDDHGRRAASTILLPEEY
jgi:hypothetical protein